MDDEELIFGAGASSSTNTTSSNNRFQHATSSTSSSSSSSNNQNRRVGNVEQNSRVSNSSVGVGNQSNAGSLEQSVDFSILNNEQGITVNWVDKILLEAFRSTNSTKRLTENIQKYEKKIESDGLLPIKEDLKDIKGKKLYEICYLYI